MDLMLRNSKTLLNFGTLNLAPPASSERYCDFATLRNSIILESLEVNLINCSTAVLAWYVTVIIKAVPIETALADNHPCQAHCLL